MRINDEIQKKIASEWFKFLQNKIYMEYQNLEKEFSKKKNLKQKFFKKKEWKKKNINDGGGIYYILNNGNGICLRLATVFGSAARMRTDLLVNNFVERSIKTIGQA